MTKSLATIGVTRGKILNVLLYQAGWFACVIGAAQGYWLAGPCVALLLVAAHLLLVPATASELKLLACSGLIGFALDSLHQWSGTLDFAGAWPDGRLAPFWIVVMWVQFATMIHYALSWLSGKYLLSAVLGAIGGPLAYWGGVRIGAADFPPSLWFSLAALGVGWAVAMPALVWLGDRFVSPTRTGYYRLPFR